MNSDSNKANWSLELNEFLGSLDNYEPTIPEAISNYYLESGGMTVKDERILKLVSLAADKFVVDILREAKVVSQLRQQTTRSAKKRAEMNEILNIDDFEVSLQHFRISSTKRRRKSDDSKAD